MAVSCRGEYITSVKVLLIISKDDGVKPSDAYYALLFPELEMGKIVQK